MRKTWITMGVAAIAAGALFGGSSAAAAGPGLGVSPSSGLTDGQQVTVALTGFPAGDIVGALQCEAGTWPNVGCNVVDAPQPVQADSAGDATQTLTVRSTFNGVNPATGQPTGTVDCTVAPGCSIRAGSQTDPANIFAEPVAIGFG